MLIWKHKNTDKLFPMHETDLKMTNKCIYWNHLFESFVYFQSKGNISHFQVEMSWSEFEKIVKKTNYFSKLEISFYLWKLLRPTKQTGIIWKVLKAPHFLHLFGSQHSSPVESVEESAWYSDSNIFVQLSENKDIFEVK